MRIGNDIYVVALEGLAETRPLDAIPDQVKRNALRAVNYAAKRSHTRSAREIRQQVAFPARYLTGQDSRLPLKTAKAFGDEAVITGRWRPTSLARFASRGGPGQDRVGGEAGVRVQVKPGQSGFVKRGFVMRLRAGTELTDTKFNLGLAIRLKPGETIQGKHTMVPMGPNGLYLLFGPSVNQVFRSVADRDVPNIEEDLQREFERLMGVEGI